MSRQNILDKLEQRPKLVYLLVFLIFLVIHVFIFRNVVGAIPEIIQGRNTVVREELVPVFDFRTQFFSEGTSDLTSSEEIRVAYSFWTAWVRHYAVLPFALVLLNAISAFILFYAFHKIGRYFSKDSLLPVTLAAILSASLIHFILLYAKVAHFYTLIIGFSLFALSLSFMLEQLFFQRSLRRRNIVIVSLLVLFNPAIHYHILFYLVFAVFAFLHTLMTFILSRRSFWFAFKRNSLYFIVVTALSLVPYAAFVAVATASSLSSVSTHIPVNYWMIYYTSIPLPFILSFDIAGHSDLFRHGDYLASSPRITSMSIAILISSSAVFARRMNLSRLKRVFLLTLFTVFMLAVWMSIGYSTESVYSFHVLLSKTVIFIAEYTSFVATLIGKLTYVFISILRFPHRFQFIYFYIGGLLITLALLWFQDVLYRRTKAFLLPAAIVVLISFTPLISNKDYREALISGDFGGLLRTYVIPQDLKHIKDSLARRDNTKLFIFPTMESGREIVKENRRFSFIDKFLIYYLNQSTFYYGVGGNTENKLPAFLAYESVNRDEQWWEEILINNLGITHILEPKNLKDRPTGIVYIPGIEKKISIQINQSEKFRVIYDGHDYALYEAIQQSDPQKHILIDMDWKSFLAYFKSNRLNNEMIYFPLQLVRFSEQNENTYLMTDSVERSFYNLYTYQEEYTFYPSSDLLPFTDKLVASSNFTNNALSLRTLYSKNDSYNHLKENVPNLVNLKIPKFTGLTGQTKQKIVLDFTVSNEGDYRIAVHGASRDNELKATVDGQEVTLQKIPSDLYKGEDYVDLTYFYADVQLKQGRHKLRITNNSDNSILVESMSFIPKSDIPQNFNQINSSRFTITPTDEPDLYKIEFKNIAQ